MNLIGFLCSLLTVVTVICLILCVVVPIWCIYLKLTDKKIDYKKEHYLLERNAKISQELENKIKLDILNDKKRWAKELLSERDYKVATIISNSLPIDHHVYDLFIRGGKNKQELILLFNDYAYKRLARETMPSKSIPPRTRVII